MGFRTMVSPNGGQAPHFHQPPPLVRQGSLYNLTLDEVQNQLGDLGKPLNSMNLDELLKSVIAAEETHTHTHTHTHNQILENPQFGMGASSSSALLGFQKQGGLNLGRTLSRKTVDEVWREIQQEHDNAGGQRMQRQATLGEMTLEDFLVRAGVVNLNQEPIPVASFDPMIAGSSVQQQQIDWLQYHQYHHQQQLQQLQHPHSNLMPMLGGNLAVGPPVFGVGGSSNMVLDVGFGENPLAVAAVASPIMAGSQDSQVGERKRGAPDEILERTVERRQKRMIKNRESAARSRARKQAYTNQLENEVLVLREKKERFKKEKEVDTIFPPRSFSKPKYQLRRTSSAPF